MTSPATPPGAPSATPPGATSSGSLLRSTLIALAIAAVLLITCVLPAEYGKDPTGVGRLLGLTQMGEVKIALAEEAAANAEAEASADSVVAAAEAGTQSAVPVAVSTGDSAPNTKSVLGALSPPIAATPTVATTERSDTTVISLPPGNGGEVKLRMAGNARARYRWEVTGGVVNYDMHGDSTNAPKDWFVSYKKAQRVASDSGALVAAFNGNHGWYWRNRGSREVLVRLITSGAYSQIDKHL